MMLLHDGTPDRVPNLARAAQFAATTCTIVSGAIAERARLEAYILYSFFMASWVYPILTHSVWSQSGWASAFRCAGQLPCMTTPEGQFPTHVQAEYSLVSPGRSAEPDVEGWGSNWALFCHLAHA